MFLSQWHEFPSVPRLARKKNLMRACVSVLLKSRTSLTCFQACVLPGQAKDLPASLCVCIYIYIYIYTHRGDPIYIYIYIGSFFYLTTLIGHFLLAHRSY